LLARTINVPATTLHIGLCSWHAFVWRGVRILVGSLVGVVESLIVLSVLRMGTFPPRSSDEWAAAGVVASIMLFLVFCYSLFKIPVRLTRRDATGIWIRFTGRRFRKSLRPLPRAPGSNIPGWLRMAGLAMRNIIWRTKTDRES
jgi:hypothetical protein